MGESELRRSALRLQVNTLVVYSRAFARQSRGLMIRQYRKIRPLAVKRRVLRHQGAGEIRACRKNEISISQTLRKYSGARLNHSIPPQSSL
jgi:hypothetical protein